MNAPHRNKYEHKTEKFQCMKCSKSYDGRHATCPKCGSPNRVRLTLERPSPWQR